MLNDRSNLYNDRPCSIRSYGLHSRNEKREKAMKIENGIITEATRAELHTYWLKRGIDDFLEFGLFVKICVANGTIILDETEEG